MTPKPIKETVGNTQDINAFKVFVNSLTTAPTQDVDGDEFFGFDPERPYDKFQPKLRPKL